MKMLCRFWNDDRGFMLTAESLFILTILVIGLVAGWKAINSAVNNELEDSANAIGSIDQTYFWDGVRGCCAATNGSQFFDVINHVDVNTCDPTFATPVEACEESDGTVEAVGVGHTNNGIRRRPNE